MQVVTIAGNIGKDAETRRTQGGDAITGFSVAVSEGRNKPTTWWDCAIWGKRGESVAQYIRKGGKISLTGRFSTREHEGKTYLQVKVSEFALQGDGARQTSQEQHRPAPQRELDDEIPF